MNGRLRHRVQALGGLLDQQKGICVACLQEDFCTYPRLHGTPRCGRDRADLPALLYERSSRGASTEEDERLRELMEWERQWEERVLVAARAAGLSAQALVFIRQHLIWPFPEGWEGR